MKSADISISMLIYSTMGAGYRFGAGITATQRVGHWSFSVGMDAYKSNNGFGLGTLYGGVNYDDGKNGFYFLNNRYLQGDKQASGILGFHLGDFKVNFEDDVFDVIGLAKLDTKDRYRTAALEFGIGDHFIGTQVYTNEPSKENVDKKFPFNKNGRHEDGNQLSSPLYYSIKSKNNVLRLGWDCKQGGYVGQNWWHRYVIPTPDFNYHGKSVPFVQIGTNQNYTYY